jgi:guanylate kinase
MKNMFVIYGPSGSGQDAILRGIGKLLPIEQTITTTTRVMRPNESDGHPYHFISREKFLEGITQEKFIEYAKTYNDDYYGLTKEEFERVRHSGRIGVWRTDFQGALTAKRLFPKITVLFIHAPLSVLESRIRRRDNPSEAYLEKRLRYIKEWLPKCIYDYKIENEEGKLDEAIQKVFAIIKEHTLAA